MYAVSTEARHEFVCPFELDDKGNPTEDATTFTLRTLSSEQRAQVENAFIRGTAKQGVTLLDGDEIDMQVRSASRDLEAVRLGVCDWSPPMPLKGGGTVKCVTKGKGSRSEHLDTASLDAIPQNAIEALAARVLVLNELSEEEEGNLPSSPSGSGSVPSSTVTPSPPASSAPNATVSTAPEKSSRAPGAAPALVAQ